MRCRPVDIMDTLSDDVLLAIFNSYLNEYSLEFWKKQREGAWRSLVQVCRRWRSVVFGSPGHLDLQLVCTARTPARDRLDAWPTLPLIIKEEHEPIRCVDNIIAVLERSDRVCQIDILAISSSNLEILFAAMQQPFPELKYLRLWSYDVTVAVVPDLLLGGFATRLEGLSLRGIPFPGLSKLLLSATHLSYLHLMSIPHSGYFSPDGMVTTLSTLTNLGSLILGFESPRSCPDGATRPPPPSKRSVLSVLTLFRFKGVTEYLEDFVALIDTPRLNELSINLFNDVVFDTPQFVQFISRTPMSRALEKAHINIWHGAAYVNFLSRTYGHGDLSVEILCRGLDWQISSVEQVCTSFMAPLSMTEDLYIYKRPGQPLDWSSKKNIENVLWVELLHPFTAVKNLYLSREFSWLIPPALQELVGGRITEVLPALENIFLELESSQSVVDSIGPFIDAREAAGHPITISYWDSPIKDKISTYYYVG